MQDELFSITFSRIRSERRNESIEGNQGKLRCIFPELKETNLEKIA